MDSLDNTVAFIIPARNEVQTVGGVVRACLQASELLGANNSVTVVSDGSTDGTDSLVLELGARLLVRNGSPSKAGAMTLGVRDTQSEYVFFVDADCVGLSAEHLVSIARPALERVAEMSVGTFDYGSPFNELVQRFPWSTGQRIFRRAIFPSTDKRLSGYNIELLLNEQVGRTSGMTYSRVMAGVKQRTKRMKYGYWIGARRNLVMWHGILKDYFAFVDMAAYRRYMEGVVTVSRHRVRRQSRLVIAVAFQLSRVGALIASV